MNVQCIIFTYWSYYSLKYAMKYEALFILEKNVIELKTVILVSL